MSNQPYKPIINWLYLGAFLVFLMVIIGGITRLTNSGLSMSDWRLFAGTFPPMSKEAWLETFEKYQQTPEFQKLNYRFELDDFKSIFWWEYIHRLIGRIMGVIFVVPFLYFLLKDKISKQLIPKLLIILFLGAFQAFVGWYMVKSGLVDRPFVSHYRLAFHLMTALLTFGFIIWTSQDEVHKNDKPHFNSKKGYRNLLISLMCIAVIQIMYGAFVAGLKGGYLYNTFPKMGDNWIAEAVWVFDPWWKNLVENRAGVQLIHRIFGMILLFMAFFTFFKSRKEGLESSRQYFSDIISGVLFVQFLFGVFTLLLKVPAWLGVLHQATAFILIFYILLLLHTFKVHRVSS
ncbi:COX15/CtaA family protein [Bacteroidota bacterium]